MSRDLEPMGRGRRGREAGRAMIIAAVWLPAFASSLWNAAGQGMHGTMGYQHPPTELLGIPMYVIGLIWMVRIYRADAEPDQHAWRYRTVSVPLALRPIVPRLMGPAGMSRGQRRRWIGRAMIILALGLPGVVLFLWIVAPGRFLGGLGYEPPPAQLVGVVLYLFGLAWMVRIHRADPEPDQHAWRYRAR